MDATSIVIDSGSRSSVCSLGAVSRRDSTSLSKLDHGVRRFRFGDSRCFLSHGMVITHGTLPILRQGERTAREVAIKLDVIQAPIPILISRKALSLMGDLVDFADCSLRLSNGDLAQLSEQNSGHLLLPIDIKIV